MGRGPRSERLGRLVTTATRAASAYEGKNESAIESELSDEIGFGVATVQRLKQGYPPKYHRITEILARFGVERGHLDREWLADLLRAAEYPDAPQLLEKLRPLGSVAGAPAPVLTNLPRPTYNRFVMRPAAFAEVIEGLEQRVAVVWIASFGGMGKTSLAIEVTSCCLRRPGGEAPIKPAFDAAVWVSDKDHPGSTSLDTLLNTIASTLGYAGFTGLDRQRKQHEVDLMLRSRRVLLVLDNYETITDPAVLPWLLRLPEPSKALVTTRVALPEHQLSTWTVELRGMTETEAGELIEQRARQIKLNGAALVAGRSEILALADGNPKALELLLGQLKLSGVLAMRPAEPLNLDYSALLDELFARSWTMLGPEARLLLMALVLFPTTADAEALAAVTQLAAPTFVQALQLLLDLALVERDQLSQPDERPRLSLHPLTRAFASRQLAAEDTHDDSLRERWMAWCVAFVAANGGFSVGEMQYLARLDAEEPTLFAALRWSVENHRQRETIQLAQGLEFYYYVRALWGKKLQLHEWWIDAARKAGDSAGEMTALATHIQLLSRRREIAAAARFLPQLDALLQREHLAGPVAFHYHHTRGLYLLFQGEREQESLRAAQGHWQWLLEHPEGLVEHMLVGARHWLATCYAHQGEYAMAQELFGEALAAAQHHGMTRLVARNQVSLALLAIEAADAERAAALLAASDARTDPADWEQRARLHWATARLRASTGRTTEALASYARAGELFARMGLVVERDQVSGELQSLASQ